MKPSTDCQLGPFFLLAVLAVAQTACSREYGKQVSVASPDGRFFLDVTEEIQGANDSDVFWQHVSLRKADRNKPILPGNVAVISIRKIANVEWKGPSEVAVEMNRSDGGRSFQMPPKETAVDGVAVKFFVWKR